MNNEENVLESGRRRIPDKTLKIRIMNILGNRALQKLLAFYGTVDYNTNVKKTAGKIINRQPIIWIICSLFCKESGEKCY